MTLRYGIVAALAVAFALGVLLHTLLYSDSWRNREHARVDLETVQAENAAAEERVEDLRRQVEALRTRPEVQERAVRSELGYVGADEIVLELGESH